MVPANRLTQAEQAQVLATLNSGEFVDQPPLQGGLGGVAVVDQQGEAFDSGQPQHRSAGQGQ